MQYASLCSIVPFVPRGRGRPARDLPSTVLALRLSGEALEVWTTGPARPPQEVAFELRVAFQPECGVGTRPAVLDVAGGVVEPWNLQP